MRTDVYASSLDVEEMEAMLKGFDGGYGGAKREKEVHVIWRFGGDGSSGCRVRLDKGTVMASPSCDAVRKLLMESRINHERYCGVEIDEMDFEKEGLIQPSLKGKRDYQIHFGKKGN